MVFLSYAMPMQAELAAISRLPLQRPSLKKSTIFRRLSAIHRCFAFRDPGDLWPDELDSSPRGAPRGFVRVVDEKTLMIPDRRGNNRLDSLRNIVRDPRVALLVLIPGIGETMRVKGQARLSADPELRASFAMGDKVPNCVIVITVERAYPQCQKALVRSKLWAEETKIPRSELPSVGQMMEKLSPGSFDGKAYDAAYPQRLKETIY